jgi:phospholipid-binding lipoprotein MlaA
VLQGEMERAGTTAVRLVINSTVGVAGFRDQAAEWGFPYHNEDFGQTLAIWTVPGGPYVMLPVFGPSNPRDTVGIVVDFFVDPLNWWARDTGREYIIFARSGLRAVDLRARNFEALEDLEKTSLDFYAAIRSLYRQRRADEISNGKSSARMPAPGISRIEDVAPAAGVKEVSRVK